MKKSKWIVAIWMCALVLCCVTLILHIEARLALPSPAPSEEPASEKFAAALRFYVSPDGDDDADGRSRSTPFRTPERARQAVRANREADGDIVVTLLPGTYVLSETLTFDARDGGTDGHTVIWTGEQAVLSGGQVLENWTDNGDGTFSSRFDGPWSRDLYVDGRRAVLAESKPLTALTVDDAGFTVRSAELAAVTDVSDVEIALKNDWTYSYIPVDAIEPLSDGVVFVRMRQPAWTTYVTTQFSIGATLRADQIQYACGSRCFLDEPGEWCRDAASGDIVLRPWQAGPFHAVLGVLEQLVCLNGTPDAPVRALRFDALSFRHTTWRQTHTNAGFICIQANVYRGEGMTGDTVWNNDLWIDSLHAVYGCYTDGVSFTDNTFTELGGGALHLGRATKNAAVTGNTFTDVAGNAVTLGGFSFFDHHPFAKSLPASLIRGEMKHVSSDNRIEDNVITRCATVYRGGVGIVVGYAARTRVEYNTISDMPYSGISFGWGWGFGGQELAGTYYTDENGRSLFSENSISYNRITDVMKELHDGGGIYTLGRNDASVIAGNDISGVHNDYGGVYLDGGSVGFTVTGNVLADCWRNYILKGDYNYCEDNYTTANTAREPDLFMWEPLDEQDVHRSFRNNYQWDEQAVAAIRAAAGARR
ncbi:MAG: right-handed parallel beta-helix repeat-containing protein [Eubacteriales bacterium]|nr:right-handed parallel beta-helix repeat-containing protein [Eubacteriales bacterium]